MKLNFVKHVYKNGQGFQWYEDIYSKFSYEWVCKIWLRYLCKSNNMLSVPLVFYDTWQMVTFKENETIRQQKL